VRVKILVINGPNLNLLGIREPHIYGSMTLDDLNRKIQALADELGDVELEFFQSNHEGAIVDLLQERHGTGLAGCILNPAGLTQHGISIHDTLKAIDYPVLEVHISNIHAREEWRKHSIISPAAKGTLMGLGWRGYLHALRHLVALAREGP
jgi:3-dehydroquinate dehydratase-2